MFMSLKTAQCTSWKRNYLLAIKLITHQRTTCKCKGQTTVASLKPKVGIADLFKHHT